jgi:acyl-CoA synthetase (AMP-forming)/AMP-acid ligase II
MPKEGPMRLYEFFDKQADTTPNAPAVICDDRITTYGEIQQQSRRIARALLATGLAPGVKVASWLPNYPAFFSVQLGIHRTAFVWMPVNPKATAAECAGNMEAFSAEWLFVDIQFVEHLAMIRAKVPTLKGVVVVNGEAPGEVSLKKFYADFSPEPYFVDVDLTAPVTLISTGGSTGRPKGVRRTSANWMALIINYRLKCFAGTKPINLVATPLSHVAGEVAQGVFAEGGVNVILPKPDPSLILQSIETYTVTCIFVPPTLLYMMLARHVDGKHDYGSLRHLMYGAAPISLEKLREAWAVFGPVMTQLYGLMEATSTVSIMAPEEHAAALDTDRFTSVGRGSPLVMIDVVDENGRIAATGEKGEVVCHGSNLCDGYEMNPEATTAAFKAGWFHTGDLGFRDEGGYVHLLDRSKDIIISGGFNVYPGEVEQVIWTHPAIQDCAVIGVPHEKWGEAVTAVVELKPGASVQENDLIELCKLQLGSIKTPKKIEIWDVLPRSIVGKVLKKDIREHYWKASGRRI